MREIRFRVWDKEQEKMVYDPYHFEIYHFSDDKRINQSTYKYYEDWRDLEDGRRYECEVMQFTGLKDNKEKEIYEHDIVSVGYGYGKVIYHAGSFMIEWIDDKEANMELLAEICIGKNIFRKREDLIVIGNIYENPELLTP